MAGKWPKISRKNKCDPGLNLVWIIFLPLFLPLRKGNKYPSRMISVKKTNVGNYLQLSYFYIMWDGYKKTEPGTFNSANLNGSMLFSAHIGTADEFINCVYMILEKNTGLFYVGKAQRLYKRSYDHKNKIIAAVRVLQNKRKVKKYSTGTLPVHIKLAELYIKDGAIAIECLVLRNTTLNDLYPAESALIRKYNSLYPALCLNSVVPCQKLPS